MRSRFVLKRERGCILCDISSPSLHRSLYGATSFNRQQTRTKSARQHAWSPFSLFGPRNIHGHHFHFLGREIFTITIFIVEYHRKLSQPLEFSIQSGYENSFRPGPSSHILILIGCLCSLILSAMTKMKKSGQFEFKEQ